MLLMYFTIIHWFTLIFFLLLMVAIVIVSYKNLNTKQFLTASLFTIPLLTFGLIGAMYGVDSVTKQAKIFNISHRDVYRNESILITGKVQNVGSFKIGSSYLIVNIYDLKKDKLSHGVFTPIVWLTDIFSDTKTPPKPLYITHEILIAENLEPKDIKTFTVSVRKPAFMQGFRIDYKVVSH